MGFMFNLHLCALSCSEYPGFIGFLDDPAHLFGNEELRSAASSSRSPG